MLRCFSLALLASIFIFSTADASAKHYLRPVVEHLEAAEHLISLQDYEKAKEQIALALKQDPKCTDALNNLGVIYLRLHQFDKAKEYFERALQIDPKLPTSLNNLGQIYYFCGNYAAAANAYKQALPYMHGHDCLLLSNLGDALTAKGDYKEAVDYYKQAVKINPNFPQALLGLGNLYGHLDSNDLAYQYVVQALKVKPNWALAYYQLGQVETARGHASSALKAYLLSLNYEKNPDYASETKKLIADLGIDPLSVDQNDLVNYQNALSRGPIEERVSVTQQRPSSSKVASLEHAQGLLAEEKWDQAERELEALIKQAQDPVLLNDLGLARSGQKDYAIAQSFYLKAIKLSKGKCTNAYYNLGQLYRTKGDLLAAKNAFRQAIASAQQQRKSCPLANNALALVLKQLGDEAGAMAAYKLAISQAGSDYPVVHYNYAILLEKMDHAREAVNEYKLYLKLAPQGSNVEQAEARLRRLGVDS